MTARKQNIEQRSVYFFQVRSVFVIEAIDIASYVFYLRIVGSRRRLFSFPKLGLFHNEAEPVRECSAP
jgi:hypothetical protein